MSVEVEDDAVTEHRRGDGGDVVDAQVVAAVHHSVDAPAFDEGLSAAGRAAVADVFLGERMGVTLVGLGSHDEVDGEILHVRRDEDGAAELAELEDAIDVDLGLDVGFVTGDGAFDDGGEVGAIGIADEDLHEEAVELRFGERIGAFHFDGVLGGHDEEGALELVSGGAGGDGAFLHGFEEGALGLGGGTVDFVGEDEIGEDGAGLEAETLGAALVAIHDHAADDVGGHEVGSELDAAVAEVEHTREGAQEGGFAEAGDTFEEYVSAAEEADEDTTYYFVLTDNDFADFIGNGLDALRCRREITHIDIL